jgi:hypothetical protein
MLQIKIVVLVTGNKESVRGVSRDSPSRKRIDSNAVLRMTVMAFLSWVGRKLLSMFMGNDDV